MNRSRLTLNEVLELALNEEDVSENESEDDELSGADFIGNNGRSAVLAGVGLRTLDSSEHEILSVDSRQDPCYRSSLLLLDQSLMEVKRERAICKLRIVVIL